MAEADKPARSIIGRSVLTQGNVNNNHFYLRGFLDAFPHEVLGGCNRASAAVRTLTISWSGASPVVTDIDKTKAIFRNRSWVREFFAKTNARPGDQVEITETGYLSYEVTLVRSS